MLTIGIITSRPEPRFDWAFSSIRRQLKPTDNVEFVICDLYAEPFDDWSKDDVDRRRDQVLLEQNENGCGHLACRWVPPMPNFWSGPSRLTKENWWTAGVSRTTCICLAVGSYWASLDDRLIVQSGWMNAVRDAAAGQYAVCGPYEKRTGVTAEYGFVKNGGIVTGRDNRLEYVNEHWAGPRSGVKNPYECPGSWFYGCSFGMPLEWALKINGVPCDLTNGSGGEDSATGILIQNNGYPIKYDTRMAVVEDRSPEFLGPGMRREDKGPIGTKADKSHIILEKFLASKISLNSFDIRRVREAVQMGHPFPRPSGLQADWFDGKALCDNLGFPVNQTKVNCPTT